MPTEIKVSLQKMKETENTQRRQKAKRPKAKPKWILSFVNYLKSWPADLWIKFTVVALLMIAACYLLRRMSTAKIRADVKVSALEFLMDTMPGRTSRFDFSLSSNGTDHFVIDSAILVGASASTHSYMPLYARPADSSGAISMTRMVFPKNAKIYLDQTVPNTLNLSVSRSPDPTRSSWFTWNVSFPKAILFNNITTKEDTLGNDGTDAANTVFEFKKDLSNGVLFGTTFHHPAPWKWPSSLYVNALSFSENKATGSEPTSSVLEGKINLLQTNDSAIYLREGNVLKLSFVDPVELFLRGDSSGFYVSFEGEVNALEAGPRIMKEENNLMPLQIKVLNDKNSYVWTLLALIVSIFTISSVQLKKR